MKKKNGVEACDYYKDVSMKKKKDIQRLIKRFIVKKFLIWANTLLKVKV